MDKEIYHKTMSDFRDELHNNILSLEVLCEQYDRGNYFLAPLIAVVLRTIIFSKGNKNSSLLENNKFGDMNFVSSISERYIPNSKIVLSPYMPLMKIQIKNGIGTYEATNSGKSLLYVMLLPLDIWWHQIALDDRKGGCYSRRDIVLTIADKFGAHSDSKVEKYFADLSFHNSLGFQYEIDGDAHNFKGNPTYVSLRQIAQEVMASYYFLYQYKVVRMIGTKYMNSAIYKHGIGYDYKCYIRLDTLRPKNDNLEKLFEDSQIPVKEKIKVSKNEFRSPEGKEITILSISK